MSCNNCGRIPCRCAGSPYYLDACAQDHTLKTYQAQYSFGFCPQSQWNVPLCGGSAVLSIPGVIGIPTGANIWHPNFGYFKITAVDLTAGTVTITNECPAVDYQAAPGTQIPGCTCFAVVPLPYDAESGTSNVCVAVSFTAPAEDTPTDITLTSTEGLTAGDTIQIGTGFYFVSEVKPNNVITIVNKGEGIVPGTPVIAQDANGNFLNCISIISVNPCDRESTDSGTLIVCDEEGLLTPLGGACQAGFIPVSIGDCNVQMQPGIIPSVCQELTVALDIVSADATYTLTVDDSSVFAVDDILIIAGIANPDIRATVTLIPTGTTLNVTLDPVPGVTETLPVGTLVCTISCCEDIIVNELPCVIQGGFSYVAGELYNQSISLNPPDNYYEVTLDSTLVTALAPDNCPGATYLIEANINVTAVVYAQPSTVPGTDYNFTSEIQADWANNAGFGGRINWTGPWPNTFSMPFSTASIPMGTLNPIWNTLNLYRDAPPTEYIITYNGGYINAVTTLAAGASTTLRLNLKILTDDQFTAGDGEVTSAGVYVIGSVKSTRIS